MTDQIGSLLLSATPEDLRAVQAQFSPRLWTVERARVMLPKAGPVDFERYPYMRAVYEDISPNITIIKGAQLGFSTWAMCRALWMLTTFSCTVIYTFPTRDQVSEYTAARIDPIISETPFLSERIVDVNSVKLKKFRRDPSRRGSGVSLVYFQGAAKESDAIAVDADLVIHDEEDKSNARVIEQYSERLTASRFKWRARLSTPTLPGKGVDKSYQLTDAMKWFVTCPGCAAEFELRFPKEQGDPRSNVEPHTYDEIFSMAVQPRFKCHRCDTTLTDLDRAGGRWVPMRTEQGLPRGYQVSQMAAPWISAYDILKGRKDSTYESDFWNLKIGIAWQSGSTAMTREALEKRTEDKPMRDVGSGTYMGVDVGKMLDVVIEDYDPEGQPHVISIKRLAWDPEGDFGELDELMRSYGVNVCVMDRLPETGMARRFAARWNRPGLTRVYLCTYKDESSNASSREMRFVAGDDAVAKPDDVATVKAPRNETLTTVADELMRRLILPRFDGSPDYEAFIEHCWNSKKTPHYEEGPEAGRAISHFVWENTGPDHLFHSLVYAYLARKAPRPLAPPIRAIISSSRASRKQPLLPDTEQDEVRLARRFQRVG